MTPDEVRRNIERLGTPYGENVTFAENIDTSSCSEFWGTRCPENVHVTGLNCAHVDRKDPRTDALGHLKHDVGVPYTAMGTAGGAALGAVAFPKNRKKGALIGAGVGSVLGIIADVVSYYNDKKKQDFEQPRSDIL